jgi:alanine racemase
MHTRPVWAEVSRADLIANYLELRHRAGSAGMLAVVKANAYGHGVEHCAPVFVSAGAAWLGVTSVEEGVRARSVAPESQILVMSGIWQGEAEAALEHRLTPLVWEGYHLDLLSDAARKMGRPPHSVPVHLEVDTGMSRQGLLPRPQSLEGFLTALHAGPALYLDGLATHFSAPESFEDAANAEQLARFDAHSPTSPRPACRRPGCTPATPQRCCAATSWRRSSAPPRGLAPV